MGQCRGSRRKSICALEQNSSNTEELCGLYEKSSKDGKAAMTRYVRIIESLRGAEGEEKATLWRSLVQTELTYWQGGGLTVPRNFSRTNQEQTNQASHDETDVQLPGIPQLGRNRGFRNRSLFCWMNSAIQLLFEIIPIRDCILPYSIAQTRAACKPLKVAERMLLSSLQDLLQSMQADDAGPPLDAAYSTYCCEVLDSQTHRGEEYVVRWTGCLNQNSDEFLIGFWKDWRKLVLLHRSLFSTRSAFSSKRKSQTSARNVSHLV
jgi:hypothetical protein